MTLPSRKTFEDGYQDLNALERLVNGGQDEVVETRLGGMKPSVSKAVSDHLEKLGYRVPVAYAAGLEIAEAVQVVEYEGALYAPLVSEVPFTASGTFEGDRFRPLPEEALRKQLACPAGAAMVGRGAMTVGSIGDLVGMPAEARKSDLSYRVVGYHPGAYALANPQYAGGGIFIWDDSCPKADHNGGTVIDPGKVFPADWSISSDVAAWFAAGTTGTGCFVMLYSGAIEAACFGLVGDGSAVEDVAAQALFSFAFSSGNPREVVFTSGIYKMTAQAGIPHMAFNTESVNRITGRGDVVIDLSGMPTGTPWLTSLERKNSPTSTEDLYTGNLLIKGISFRGDRTKSISLDGDALYNVEVTDCNFRNIFKCFSSGYAKGIYPGGYFQSLFVHHCRFTNCGNGTDGGIIYGNMGFNITFNDNFCEAGNRGYGVRLFGGASQALRIQNNVYEGGSRFIQLTNTHGVISGNYLEANNFGVNSELDGAEILINDAPEYAVASTITIDDNILFAKDGATKKLVQYTGIRENNLRVTNNQVRSPTSYIYYSTNSRPGYFKNNSNHVNLVTDPDTGNRNYTIEGGSYRKAYTSYLPASGTRNLTLNLEGAGELTIKITAVLSGRPDGVTVEYRIVGGLLGTSSSYKLVEVMKSDADSPSLIDLGTPVVGTGTLTVPITTNHYAGGKVFVSIDGVLFESGVESYGFTAADPDVCKISLVTP